MKNRLTRELLSEWDSKVQNDSQYGREQKLINKFLNRYPDNNDELIVAAKISIIDLTNSTQLTNYKAKISLSDLVDIIVGIENFDKRVKDGDPELVEEISNKTENFNAQNDRKGVNLFSFASKYCHYHNYFIYGRDDYSIYDSVVAEHLYEYSLDENPIFKTTPNKWRLKHDYKDFNNYIGKILDANGIGSDIEGRRRCFDHYLWFKNR